MKYISIVLLILIVFNAAGCRNTANDIFGSDSSSLPEIPEFTVSVPSASDMPEDVDIQKYLHFISTANYILTEETWYEAEVDGTQPADDTPVICFNPDGTGTVWFDEGDGHTATEFMYAASESWVFTLTALNPENCEPLEDRWKKIRISMDMWFGTDEYILYITLLDGTVLKYYSDTAERMEDGSIKYSDGTISPSDIRP